MFIELTRLNNDSVIMNVNSIVCIEKVKNFRNLTSLIECSLITLHSGTQIYVLEKYSQIKNTIYNQIIQNKGVLNE